MMELLVLYINWDLCIQNGLECWEKWFEHTPESVAENEDVKILWDLRIQTDKQLEHNRLLSVVMHEGEGVSLG